MFGERTNRSNLGFTPKRVYNWKEAVEQFHQTPSLNREYGTLSAAIKARDKGNEKAQRVINKAYGVGVK